LVSIAAALLFSSVHLHLLYTLVSRLPRFNDDMSSLSALLLLLPLASAIPVASLSPTCAPGGNFDLSPWSLQLPIGSTGNPDIISASSLEGCSGYENYSYFFTESGDGALVMKVPGSPASSGCVTTPNSQHCRTELAENASWSPNGATNKLSVTLAVPTPDNSNYGTVIGQVHMASSVSTKPVCELYYSTSGDLTMGVEQTRSGGNEVMTNVGNVPVGTTFSYEIVYENNVLSVSINGGSARTLSTYSLDAPTSYFKAGNYNQGSDPSDVHFFSISISH
jgi:hypothetical protein